jgi:hypothetical protein
MRSTVVNSNSCSSGWPGGNGGGLYSSGILTVDYYMIAQNFTGGGGDGGTGSPQGGNGGDGGSGGGIYSMGAMKVRTSMVTANVCGAGGDGGTGCSNELNISQTPNGAGGNGGNGGSGGGIFQAADAPAARLLKTVVAGNSIGGGGKAGAADPIDSVPGPGSAGFLGSGAELSGGFTITPGGKP